MFSMERVSGIGGFFFAASNPAGLMAWYSAHLGVDEPPATYDDAPWRQSAGVTIFAPAEASADHLQGRPWVINFRVSDLDAMVAQLRGAGVPVRLHDETYPNGRFADLADPEGNPIQLWQPVEADTERP